MINRGFLGSGPQGYGGGDSPENYLRRATQRVDRWVDGDNGSDSNDGSSLAKARLTYDNLHMVLPHQVEDCVVVIHSRGDVASGASLWLPTLGAFGAVVLDGGDGVTVVDDNSGANFSVAATTSASQLVTSGTPWSVDEHKGWWIQILDAAGVPTGQIRMVYEGSAANTLIPANDFDPAPSIGSDQFRIVRPTSKISVQLHVHCDGGGQLYDGTYNSRVYIQRLYTTAPVVLSGSAAKDLGGFISHQTTGNKFVTLGYGLPSVVQLNSGIADPVTMGVLAGFAASFSGIGDEQLRAGPGLSLVGWRAVMNSLDMVNAAAWLIECRVSNGATFTNCGKFTPLLANILTFGGRTPKFGSAAGAGLTVKGGAFEVAAADCSDCGTHGIDNQGAVLTLGSGVVGSGNAGHGVKNGSGGAVHVTDGAMPSVTGGAGADDLLQGATTTTWAALDAAGQVIETAADLAVAKEV